MNTTISTPVAELLQSQQNEVALYKWTESEKVGFDIGWDRAREEWFDRCFLDWVREQRRLIDEVLATGEYGMQLHSRSSSAVAA